MVIQVRGDRKHNIVFTYAPSQVLNGGVLAVRVVKVPGAEQMQKLVGIGRRTDVIGMGDIFVKEHHQMLSLVLFLVSREEGEGIAAPRLIEMDNGRHIVVRFSGLLDGVLQQNGKVRKPILGKHFVGPPVIL